MKKAAAFDKSKFVAQVQGIAGTHFKRPRRALLGNPITGEVKIPKADADYPGQVWLHEAATPYAQVDTDGTAREDDSVSIFTGFLKANTIPKSQLVLGLPVLIKPMGNIWEVVDQDGIAAAEYLDDSPDLAVRGIDISEIDYGLVRPTNPPSMRVLITEALYNPDGSVYYAGTKQSDNLTQYRSGLAAGKARAVQILLDPVTGALSYNASNPFTDNRDSETGLSDHRALFAFYPNTVPSALFNIGWVKVYYNMTAVQMTDILPGGEWFTKTGSAGAIIDLILTDEDGNILVDDAGNVLYGEE